MKNKIFVRISLLLTVLFFIILTGCKKEPEEVGNGEILQAYPGIQGELVEFVINGDTITCEKINGKYVFGGDMILTEDQLFHSDTTKGAGQPVGVQLWPNGIVYYEIDAGISDLIKSSINQAIEDFKKYTKINFIEDNTRKNFVKFVPSSEGNDSNLGMISSKSQEIHMHKTDKGSVIHEICHTLGMIHEQQRLDRDKYVTIKFDNIYPSRILSNFWWRTSSFIDDFDFNSIMLYPCKTTDITFAKDITKPIITKADGSQYDKNWWNLSPGDIELINSMYSKACIVSPPIVMTYKASNISEKQAFVGGKVTFNGNAYITDRGIIWRKSSDPESSNTKIQIGEGNGSFSTLLSGLTTNTEYYVRAYATNSIGTDYGDQLGFTTNSGNSDIIFNPDLTYGTLSDVDGNIYKTIQIGSQTWMAENLKTTKFNDGTNIPPVPDPNAWRALSTPGYCWYNNDAETFKANYGALYNWYAVDALSNSGKNVCPAGWHVPTDDQWTVLTDYLTNNGYGYGGSKTWISKSMASQSGWTTNSATNTIGSNQANNNSSGFTALPSGGRFATDLCIYTGIGGSGCWWSTTLQEPYHNYAYTLSLRYYTSGVYRLYDQKQFGYSVRCLKDN